MYRTVISIDFTDISTVCQDRKGFRRSTNFCTFVPLRVKA